MQLCDEVLPIIPLVQTSRRVQIGLVLRTRTHARTPSPRQAILYIEPLHVLQSGRGINWTSGGGKTYGAWDNTDAPITRALVCEEVLDHSQAGHYLAVLPKVLLGWRAIGRSTVERPALAARIHRNETRPVVQAPALAQDRVEVRRGLGVRKHVPERLTVRVRCSVRPWPPAHAAAAARDIVNVPQARRDKPQEMEMAGRAHPSRAAAACCPAG